MRSLAVATILLLSSSLVPSFAQNQGNPPRSQPNHSQHRFFHSLLLGAWRVQARHSRRRPVHPVDAMRFEAFARVNSFI
jgi:hypothetical protein